MKLLTCLSCAALATALPNLPPSYGGSQSTPFFYKGFDLSSLKILEDGQGPGAGAIFKDTARDNATRPAEDILGDGGMNVVRLRLWVYPKAPYDGGYYESYGLNYTLPLAKRMFDKGYKIYLDYREWCFKLVLRLNVI